MQRNILNVLKHSLKSPITVSNLLNTQKRSFFFRSQGDYDFFTPLVNFGMWTAAFATTYAGVAAYRYGYKQGLKNAQSKSSTSFLAIEDKSERSSALSKP